MKYEVGDRVILTGEVKRPPWAPGSTDMNDCIGQVGTISKVLGSYSQYRVANIGPENDWWYIHEDDLAPAVEPDTFASLEADDV